MRLVWVLGVCLFMLLFFSFAPKAAADSSGTVTITVQIRRPAQTTNDSHFTFNKVAWVKLLLLTSVGMLDEA
jgi:hypothetical protein